MSTELRLKATLTSGANVEGGTVRSPTGRLVAATTRTMEDSLEPRIAKYVALAGPGTVGKDKHIHDAFRY